MFIYGLFCDKIVNIKEAENNQQEEKTAMKLDLKIDKEKISVLCEIPVQKDSYSFALAHTLERPASDL